MKTNRLFAFLTSLIVLLFNAQPAQAWFWNREKKIDLVKQVWDHQEQAYVDDLSTERSHAYTPDEGSNQVKFKIIVTNSGDVNLKKIIVKDILPTDYLKYLSGDFKDENGELKAEINDLKKKEIKELEFTTEVVDQDQLPAVAGHYCSFNTVQAEIDGEEDKFEDKARVCIAPDINVDTVEEADEENFGLSVLPEAGPIDSVLILFSSITSGLIGFKLIRKEK